MLSFLQGPELSRAIANVSKEREVRCAVAFWGKGAAGMFGDLRGRDVKIICNLGSGGTNPRVISGLLDAGAQVKQRDDLHAKVYMGGGRAVVASANASANGLGLEGFEQARWLEAGTAFPDTGDVVGRWFDTLWMDRFTREIEGSDIHRATAAWEARQAHRPSVLSFAEFDVEGDRLPLVSWCGNDPSTYCEDSLKRQFGSFDRALKARLDGGVEVEGPGDRECLLDRWVLFWTPKSSGKPKRNTKPWWVCLGGIVAEKALRYDEPSGEPLDVVLAAESRPPEPFDAADALFCAAFFDVIEDAAYNDLRARGYEGAFFAPRKELTRSFWPAVKRWYGELAAPDR